MVTIYYCYWDLTNFKPCVSHSVGRHDSYFFGLTLFRIVDCISNYALFMRSIMSPKINRSLIAFLRVFSLIVVFAMVKIINDIRWIKNAWPLNKKHAIRKYVPYFVGRGHRSNQTWEEIIILIKISIWIASNQLLAKPLVACWIDRE